MSADTIKPPWIEGEKIPDSRLREIFHQPPGAPPAFYRSSLVVGSRGVGKTTLFRYHKEVHEGIAVHISLATEFASLTKQTAIGPLSVDFSPALAHLVCGKATALLAVSIAERLTKKGLSIPPELLRSCLPADPSFELFSVDAEWVVRAKNRLATMALEKFETISEARPLPSLVSVLGEESQKLRGPLLLLLDRADMVPAPCLLPVFELLDQSAQFIALVAMRPGHGGDAILRGADAIVAGDHYAVIHLGTQPRSQDWRDFIEKAVSVQVGSKFRVLPEDIKRSIVAVSRDSIRTALELSARYLAVPTGSGRRELNAALEDLRENHLAAAQRTLQKYHPDFRRMVNDLRAEALNLAGGSIRPLLLSLESSPQETLFEAPTRLNRFIDLAVRSGAFCLPEGQRWVPGLRPAEVEINPILLWKEGLKLESGPPVNIRRHESEILRSRGGPAKPPSIFIAYRMSFEESQRFRHDLEEAIRSHPNLAGITVTDGRVPAGAVWADVIRQRIRNAKAVVGDVTGMRTDVLFELGFAYGLRTVTIPAVAHPGQRSSLPRWLGATQIGHYGDRSGLLGVVASIDTHLSDPEFARTLRTPQPIPSLSVWLRELDWNAHAMEQFSTVTTREGIKSEVISPDVLEEDLIRRAASAALLVVSLDGTEADALVHFICGAVAAKPKAGHAGTLPRLILILEEPSQTGRTLVADSLRRCRDTVKIIREDQVRTETDRFCRMYKQWSAGSTRKRSRP